METSSDNSSSNLANSVAQAIAVSLDWTSSPDARKAAVAFLESIKTGDVRVSANTALILVKKDWSSEIRLHAFKMLQHLVRLRWDELNSTEHRNFAIVTVDLMSEIANPSEEWALKSQTAALVAEIVRSEGVDLWQELVPAMVSLSGQGPVQAELVSMMLRWLPEDITVHNEDLEADRRRLLLRGLAQSLPEILPLLYTLLERHFGAALSEAGKQQIDLAKQHASAVTATLNAINAYSEWAPLPDLAKYGIIHGCGFLLSSPDFRLHACDFFKLVSARKRISDTATPEFDSAMSTVFQILMNASKEFLHHSGVDAGAINESNIEFAEYLCESMVYLGSSNLQCIMGDSTALHLYLQQMTGFFQHQKFVLHFQSLQFWQALLRDLMSKPKVAASADGSDHADKEKQKILVSDDICSVLLDVSFQRLLKREKILPGTSFSLGTLELWSDDVDSKGNFSQYRSKLLELIKFVTSYKPVIAGAKVSERIDTIIKNLSLSPMPAQDLGVIESMQSALENVVSAIFDGSNVIGGGQSEVQVGLCGIFEGLLQQLLSLNWTEPTLVEVLGHYLAAMGPFLNYSSDAAGRVIHKLFELLNSLPFTVKDPSTSSARYARLQICTSFIRIAKTADKSILPHMKGIADMMAYLQKEGRLLRGEHNLLGEAFLVLASAAGFQQQQEVLAWLLEPLSQQWTQIEWQNNYLSEPLGLVRLCVETPTMWSVFHCITFFEKALKRSGMRKTLMSSQNNSAADSTPLHPMASHLSWILPPLPKLLRVIHSLWSPSIYQTLPGEMKGAMIMSDTEQYSLLGEGNPKLTRASTSSTGPLVTMSKEGYTEPNESDIRNWMKGIRDSGYNVLGLATTVGDSFYRCLDSRSVALALVENIQSMEFRHMRLLVHSVLIPLIRNCPVDLWEVWLEKLLQPLLVHANQALSCSWSSLLQEGKAKVPDVQVILVGTDSKVEVMEEKLLRDLTREICSLLSLIASPQLNTGLPSLEHYGQITKVDLPSLKALESFSSSSMVGFVLKHQGFALPALQICLESFKWTDGESMPKVSAFCGALVVLAIFTNSMELQQFVANDLFSAIIQGLALESNAFISADLVGHCRDIYIYLCDRHPAPREVLLSLPCIKQHDLLAFEEALTKTASPKEQKQFMKSLLLLATGNKLKALVAQKSVNVITNVTTKPRNIVNVADNRAEEGEVIGLAALS